MRVRTLVQAAVTVETATIGAVLNELLGEKQYDHVQVAVAYASVAGTRRLLQACSHVPDLQTNWLVGLDDLVTQPGAIDLVHRLPDSTLRVAALGGRPYRFHPKVCRFKISDRQSNQLVMLGSANLTKSALGGNSESVVFLESQSRQDERVLDAMWEALWIQGHVPAAQELEAYRERYEEARPLRARIRDLAPPPRRVHGQNIVEIIERDTAELDPSRASTCWIECGRVTAMGRELELKGEQGLFFGLSHADDEKIVSFRLSNGEDASLRLKYQENAMWRVQMNNDVPEVRAGLRPRL